MLRRVVSVAVATSMLSAALIALVPSGGAATVDGDPVVAAAGDICGSSCMSTANLILSHPEVDTVLTLGDNAYPCGSLAQFNNKYNPTWGQFLSKTMSSIGNHEYEATNTGCDRQATGYFTYFGTHAQPTGIGANGYFYFDVTGTGTSAAKWRIIVLNGNCSIVSCASGSLQEQFLASAISGAPSGSCVMAAWHQARFTGSSSAPKSAYLPFWTDLYAAHAALILNAHAHYYERYVPQNPSGTADPTNGIAEIIAGTGGASHGTPKVRSPNTAFLDNTHFGALFVTLRATSYDWEFIATDGTVIDSSAVSAPCTPRP